MTPMTKAPSARAGKAATARSVQKRMARRSRGFLRLPVASSLAEPHGEDNGELVGAFALGGEA